jgi:hypothetical protein
MTVLFCCNADSYEKLCPMIAGKFEKPRCPKGLQHCPCNCKSENEWVTGRLFREWLAKTGMSF